MIKDIESQTITAAIGATLRAVFIIENVGTADGYTAIFSCPDLKIEEHMSLYEEDDSDSDSGEEVVTEGEVTTLERQVWLLERTTEDLRPGEFFYNMTLTRYIGLHPFPTTYVYHGRLIILPEKPPRTKYNPYYEYPHNTKNEHD